MIAEALPPEFIEAIADEKILFESPYPEDVFCYTPSLCRGFGGRILAGFDLGGPGTARLEGVRSDSGDYESGNQFRILLWLNVQGLVCHRRRNSQYIGHL